MDEGDPNDPELSGADVTKIQSSSKDWKKKISLPRSF